MLISILSLIVAPTLVGIVLILFEKWLDNRGDN